MKRRLHSLGSQDSSGLLRNYLRRHHNQGTLATYSDDAWERLAVHRYTELNHRVHNCELLAVFFTLISFAVATVHYELQFELNLKDKGKLDMPIIVTAMLSLASALYYILRQYYKRQLSQFKLPRRRILMFYPDVFDYHLFRRNHSRCCTLDFALTLVLLLLQPIPYVHQDFSVPLVTPAQGLRGKATYSLNDMLYASMAIRAIFICKVLLSYSKYTSLKAKRIARFHGVSANARFALRAMIVKRPALTVFTLILLSVLLLSFLLRIFERPFHIQEPHKSYVYANPFDAVWVICITLTTVGYGDIAPSTLFGRLVAIFSAFWGAVIISLMIVIVTNGLNLNESQSKAVKDIQLMESASQAIFYALKFNHARNHHARTRERKAYRGLRFALMRFQMVRRDILQSEGLLGPNGTVLSNDTALQIARIRETQALILKRLDAVSHALARQNGSLVVSGLKSSQ